MNHISKDTLILNNSSDYYMNEGKTLEINTLLESSMDRKYAVDIFFSFNSDSPTHSTFYISLFIVEYRAISVTKLQTNLLRKLTYNT